MAEMEKFELEVDQELLDLETRIEKEGLSEEDFFKLSFGEVTQGEETELSADDLELVVGGISRADAIKVIADTYWDVFVKHRKTRWGKKQINDALKKLEAVGTGLLGLSKKEYDRVRRWIMPI